LGYLNEEGKAGKVQGYFTGCDMIPSFYDELRATGNMLDVGIFKPANVNKSGAFSEEVL
jgi:pilus assembly protein CpaF